jgi:GAF domain-containing protein
VTRWDDERQVLVPIGNASQHGTLRLGEGASGRAARQRMPIVMHTLMDEAAEPALARADLRAAIAVPLLHEGRLVGTLAVGTDDPLKVFSIEDSELIETLGSTAAAALLALERVRLEGALLAARTAQHELNNQLAAARGFAEMLVDSPDLPPHLTEIAEEVKGAADDAVDTVRQLRSISHIEEHRWSATGDTTIDLAASTSRRR